ncbi:hypothetical protein RTG_01704 [Rhodotorula toruloides ATCC 204091]|uniref:Uncharacterized protein n=1 Tax=Rhodotorula toruloides TaxID=5286 RepID=A0A0K3CJ24_RHOTO|nr:hypothetical protein RTG_01704 [Rhodotorula toruloides ATCC 204091]PRQ71605.1 hypothetical protein AAT19DRAFT_9720 [Rhodotorula toruloides]
MGAHGDTDKLDLLKLTRMPFAKQHHESIEITKTLSERVALLRHLAKVDKALRPTPEAAKKKPEESPTTSSRAQLSGATSTRRLRARLGGRRDARGARALAWQHYELSKLFKANLKAYSDAAIVNDLDDRLPEEDDVEAVLRG